MQRLKQSKRSGNIGKSGGHNEITKKMVQIRTYKMKKNPRDPGTKWVLFETGNKLIRTTPKNQEKAVKMIIRIRVRMKKKAVSLRGKIKTSSLRIRS